MNDFLKWMMGPSAEPAARPAAAQIAATEAHGGPVTGYLPDDDGARSTGTYRQTLTAEVLVSMRVTNAVRTTARNVSGCASRLATAQTFATINGTTTTTIDDGGPDVIDVTGGLQKDRVMTLSGGARISPPMFSLTDIAGHAAQSDDGCAFVGTFLAARGGQYNASTLDCHGELINGDRKAPYKLLQIPQYQSLQSSKSGPPRAVKNAFTAHGLPLRVAGPVVLHSRRPQRLRA